MSLLVHDTSFSTAPSALGPACASTSPRHTPASSLVPYPAATHAPPALPPTPPSSTATVPPTLPPAAIPAATAHNRHTGSAIPATLSLPLPSPRYTPGTVLDTPAPAAPSTTRPTRCDAA